MLKTNVTPKEITRESDGEIKHDIASFGYYDGHQFAKDNNLKQTTDFQDVRKGTHFIVCCGDIMVKVEPTDYPDIERRIL